MKKSRVHREKENKGKIKTSYTVSTVIEPHSRSHVFLRSSTLHTHPTRVCRIALHDVILEK
jgi:hypothetical protein